MHLGHLLLVILQRQKSAYTAYPKAEPTPVASSAPPASSLYSSPVVSLPFSSAPVAWTAFLWDERASDCASAGMLESPGQGQRQPGPQWSRGHCKGWRPHCRDPRVFHTPQAGGAGDTLGQSALFF